MRFNHLLSFLPVTFSFGLPPALLFFSCLTSSPLLSIQWQLSTSSCFFLLFLLPLLSNYSSPSFFFSFLFFPHLYLYYDQPHFSASFTCSPSSLITYSFMPVAQPLFVRMLNPSAC